MSFILKALQKLDEEKAAQRARPQDINRAILTAGRPAPRPSRVSLASAVVGLLLLAGVTSAYLLLQLAPQPVRKPAPLQPWQESRKTAPPLTSTAAASPAPAAGSTNPAGPAAQTAGPPDKTLLSAKKRREDVSQAAPSQTVDKTGKEPARREQSYGPPPAGLKVNGIALQDNPAESVAVVNGLLVRRGMVIQGMRVEEILGDRVRFSGSGGRCEVQISR